jgi:hypothetical protein
MKKIRKSPCFKIKLKLKLMCKIYVAESISTTFYRSVCVTTYECDNFLDKIVVKKVGPCPDPQHC